MLKNRTMQVKFVKDSQSPPTVGPPPETIRHIYVDQIVEATERLAVGAAKLYGAYMLADTAQQAFLHIVKAKI